MKEHGAFKPDSRIRPDPLRKEALKQDVLAGLPLAPAELSHGLMGPSPDGKPIRRPKSILDSEPSEERAFWRGPSLPNNGHEGARGGTDELRLVSGLGRVYPELVSVQTMESSIPGVTS